MGQTKRELDYYSHDQDVLSRAVQRLAEISKHALRLKYAAAVQLLHPYLAEVDTSEVGSLCNGNFVAVPGELASHSGWYAVNNCVDWNCIETRNALAIAFGIDVKLLRLPEPLLRDAEQYSLVHIVQRGRFYTRDKWQHLCRCACFWGRKQIALRGVHPDDRSA